MYTLSIKQINTEEDVFFGDNPNNRILLTKFENLLHRRNQHLFADYCVNKTREVNQDGHFVFHRKIGNFKTQQDAKEYFNIYTDSRKEIRILSREWNQNRRVLSTAEINVVGTDTKIVLLDCLKSVCERFGGQCSTSGCSTVHFVEQFKLYNLSTKLVGLVGLEPTTERL